MSLFDDAIQADAALLFDGDADGPGETIQVKEPADSDWREIRAIVNRRPPEQISGDGSILTPMMTLCVANHATLGIATASFDGSGNTRVKLGRRNGQTAEEFGLYLPQPGSVRAHNAGMFSLDVK